VDERIILGPLAEYGIKKRLAHESRQLARIPDDDWEKHVSKITGKILNPPPKPKSQKLDETVVEQAKV
jgi:hypothetical protein